jgi:hypothetical protein
MPSRRFTKTEYIWLTVLSLIAFGERLALAFRSIPAITVFPYSDDAFYVFSVAKHLAAGHGPTVDGSHLTNGFQPLIAVLYTPLFWLSHDPWTAVRASFVLAGIIAVASIWIVARLARSFGKQPTAGPLGAPIIGAFLWTFSMTIFLNTTNGLETGLYSLLLLASLTYYIHVRNDIKDGKEVRNFRWMIFGTLLGLTVLARIDAAILVATITVYEAIHKRIRGATRIAITAFIVSLPWWIYNIIFFGSLMPTSAQAENSWPIDPADVLRRTLQAITDIALLVAYAPDSLSLLARSILAMTMCFAIVIIIRKANLLSRLKERFDPTPLLPFVLFVVVLLVYYTIFFRAPHFIPRYLQPLRILWLLLATISIATIYSSFSRPVSRIGIAAYLFVAVAFGVDRYLAHGFVTSAQPDFYAMGQWALQHSNEKIGMLQSGLTSFESPNVINLDGKVNTDALHAHQRGTLGEYIRDEQFMYLADWKPFVEDIAAMASGAGAPFDSIGRIGNFQIMRRRDAR